MFQVHILKNIWQLLMFLFQFIPKSGIFDDFQFIRHTESISIFQNTSKCTISTFSAEINNRKSCCQMRFPSWKYTKMHLRWGPHCTAGAYSTLRSRSSWWGGLTVPLTKTPSPLSALRASSFRISTLGLKEVVHLWYRLNVCLSHAGIVSKWLNLSSNCLHCLVAPWF